MKVSISVGGRFHAFDLAKQLNHQGHLSRLITSYPKFKAREWGLKNDQITSILSHELLNRGLSRASTWTDSKFNPQYWLCKRFDRLAARSIPTDTDIHVAWAAQALHCIRRTKALGGIAVVERGSAHTSYQTELLNEEFDKYGLTPVVAHPKIIEREQQEYREADWIFVPSAFAKNSFIECGVPAEKIIQILYGVDLKAFYAIPKEDQVFRLIHCGQIGIQKGAHYLLQAFHELNLPNSELWLIGHLPNEILPFIKKCESPNIILKGTQPQNELYRYYSQGSVFCLASIQDGMGMVIPQAMACGLPIICTVNTGGPDLIQNGNEGFVIPIRNVDALKEKILYMYENQAICRQMGKNALDKITRSRLTWSDYGDRMIQAYKDILEHRKQSGRILK